MGYVFVIFLSLILSSVPIELGGLWPSVTGAILLAVCCVAPIVNVVRFMKFNRLVDSSITKKVETDGKVEERGNLVLKDNTCVPWTGKEEEKAFREYYMTAEEFFEVLVPGASSDMESAIVSDPQYG